MNTSKPLLPPHPGYLIPLQYKLIVQVVQRKNLAQDLDRRKAFHSRTAPAADTRLLGSPTAVTGGRSERVAEKMLDRYAIPSDRAELPVHGAQMGERSSGQSQGWMNGDGGESTPAVRRDLL